MSDKDSNAAPAVDFHHFADLPAELRDEIWRLCLPERVCELDIPVAFNVFLDYEDGSSMHGNGQYPCKLYHTTEMNKRPPLISRVCHESRVVAFKSGAIMPDARGGHWLEEEWHSIDVEEAWRDPESDLLHLNWHAVYEADCGFSNGSPLHCLAWAASNSVRGGSLTFEYLENLHASRCVSLTTDYRNNTYNFPPLLHFKPPEDPSEKRLEGYERARHRDLDALNRISKCFVVMQTVVVHSDVQSAAGLFGLLGDARVQIVDICEETKVNAFLDFAERCERKNPRAVKQHFRLESNESMESRVKAVIKDQFGNQKVLPTMRPAIMFRLCTQMCNRLKYEQEEEERRRRRQNPQRGRGHGRRQ